MASEGIDLKIRLEADEAERVLKAFAKAAKGSIGEVEKEFTDLEKSAIVFNQSIELANKAFSIFNKTVGATIATFADFEKSVFRTASLGEGTAKQIDLISEASIQLAKQFGIDATAQVNAYYEAVSAGAKIGSESVEILTAANKLSIGGVVDLTQAIRALVGVQNAYGKETTSLSDINQAFFAAARGGLTNIDELSKEIGGVAPNAALAGVSMQELFSAVSAVTSLSVSTSEAVTQVNAAITQLFSPTDDLKKLLKDGLGIDDVSKEIKQNGFVELLRKIGDASGNSFEAFNRLFSEIRATRGAVNLATGGYKSFKEILELTNSQIDLTTQAVEIQNKSLDRSFDSLLSNSKSVVIAIGKTFAPFIKGVADITNSLVKLFIPSADEATNKSNEFDSGLAAIGEESKKIKARLEFVNKQIVLFNKQIEASGDANGFAQKNLNELNNEFSNLVLKLAESNKAAEESAKSQEKSSNKIVESKKKTIAQTLQDQEAAKKAAEEQAKIEKEKLEKLNQLNKEFEADFLKQKDQYYKKLTDQLEDNVKATTDAVAKAQEERVKKQIENIKTATSTGIKGFAKVGAEALGGAFGGAAGAEAAGQFFDLFSLEAKDFSKKLESLFSVDFVGNVLRNIGVLVSKLPQLIGGVLKELPKQVFEGAKDALFGFSEPIESEVDRTKDILKEFEQSAIEIQDKLHADSEKSVKDYNENIERITAQSKSKIEENEIRHAEKLKAINTKFFQDIAEAKKQHDSNIQSLEQKKQSLLDSLRDKELEKERKRFDDANTAYQKTIDERKRIEDQIKSVEEKLADETNQNKIDQVTDGLTSEQEILSRATSDRKKIESDINDLIYQQKFAANEAEKAQLQVQIDALAASIQTARANEETALNEFNAKKATLNAQYGVVEKQTLQQQLDDLKAQADIARTNELTALGIFNTEKAVQDKIAADKEAEIRKGILKVDGEIATEKKRYEAEVALVRIRAENERKKEAKKNKKELPKIEKEKNDLLLAEYRRFQEEIDKINAEFAEKRKKEQEKTNEDIKKEADRIAASAGPEPTESKGIIDTVVDFVTGLKAPNISLPAFAEGGFVPSGFPNDTFPARLTSGELVVPSGSTDSLFQLIDVLADQVTGLGKNNVSRETGQAASNQNLNIVLQVGEQQLANVILNLNRHGLRVA